MEVPCTHMPEPVPLQLPDLPGTRKPLRLSRREAADILDRFQPELVVGTGGYASYKSRPAPWIW